MFNKYSKFLFITISIMVLFSLLWIIFDFSSKADVLIHPENYSFRMNFASSIMQNDYYMNVKYSNEIKSFYNDLKTIEKEYGNKSDEVSLKIIHLNNQAFDLYHDLLSLHMPKTNISNQDFIFLNKNCKKLADFYYVYLMTYPKLEEKSLLFEELNMRKDAIAIIKKDLKDRKIDASIRLKDIRFENLAPAYLENNEPISVKEFHKEFDSNVDSIYKKFDKDFDNALKKAKNEEEKSIVELEFASKFHSEYTKLIDNLNVKWKHRYLVSVIEYKNNKESKIIHLYEINPYKEGNRIYWNVQYYSPSSEFLKIYMKMLESLINF